MNVSGIFNVFHCILQIVYGGKVLDQFDRRILLAYLDEYFGDFLFDEFQPFHFYKGNNREQYVIPYAANSKAEFLGNFLHSSSSPSNSTFRHSLWLALLLLLLFVTLSRFVPL